MNFVNKNELVILMIWYKITEESKNKPKPMVQIGGGQ